MSLVRLLGFKTLNCGCVIGRYRELATSRELTYVEEKGTSCDLHGHRRNHTVTAERLTPSVARESARESARDSAKASAKASSGVAANLSPASSLKPSATAPAPVLTAKAS